MTATITLTRLDTGARLTEQTFSDDDWAAVLKAALYFLRIEIFPYWQYGQLAMDGIADDAQLATALQTVALIWGWCEGALPERL